MRSAESRLGIVESLDAAMRGAGRTWELIRVPRKVTCWGLVAGGSALGVALLWRIYRGVRRMSAVAPPVAAAAPQGSALAVLGRLLVQSLPVLLAPWLKQQMLSGGSGRGLLSRMHPGHLIIRWLGLEK